MQFQGINHLTGGYTLCCKPSPGHSIPFLHIPHPLPSPCNKKIYENQKKCKSKQNDMDQQMSVFQPPSLSPPPPLFLSFSPSLSLSLSLSLSCPQYLICWTVKGDYLGFNLKRFLSIVFGRYRFSNYSWWFSTSIVSYRNSPFIITLAAWFPALFVLNAFGKM
mmetsp:Transcript_17197/g.22679  ORF Transcript_17197/g.22679 Transcript_17197/m.22679 type:complete len:163 (+) Transcript_17197:589-1077(+)